MLQYSHLYQNKLYIITDFDDSDIIYLSILLLLKPKYDITFVITNNIDKFKEFMNVSFNNINYDIMSTV